MGFDFIIPEGAVGFFGFGALGAFGGLEASTAAEAFLLAEAEMPGLGAAAAADLAAASKALEPRSNPDAVDIVSSRVLEEIESYERGQGAITTTTSREGFLPQFYF